MDLLHIFNLEKVLYLLGIEWFKGLGCVPLVLALFKNDLGRMMMSGFFFFFGCV